MNISGVSINIKEKHVCSLCGTHDKKSYAQPILDGPFKKGLCSRCFTAISIYSVYTCPLEELPLYLNHEIEDVRDISSIRLKLHRRSSNNPLDPEDIISKGCSNLHINMPKDKNIKSLIEYAVKVGYLQGLKEK